ncbi:protein DETOXIFICATION 46, chloroplastic [Sesamum indicum]|uniref:Protein DETOXIFICATION n=1 Tax=Sesamum indicum TaxID=4182 RepID=A0A6I9TU78_SESIN|nr:protein DETOXIFICATION 46, chloroplastic [Sesamum indicum]
MNFETLTHHLHFHCSYFQTPNRKFNPNFISPKISVRILRCRDNRSVIRNCGYPSRGVDNPIHIFPTEEEKEEAAVVEKMQMFGEVSENIREELSESGSLWDQITEIVKFSGPVVGLWLCGPLMSLIDTAVVGQSSSVELAALGPGTVFSDCASYLFMFLSIATSNLVATSLAQQDKSEVQHQISILLFVGLACGIMMLFFTKFYGRWALTAFAGANNADIITAANTYVQIRGLVWPVWLVGSVAQSASLGMKDSWGPIKALAVASAINGVGDIVLCKFLGLGIAGAAWATMVSQVVAAYMMIDALNKKGYNGFAISIPSPNEFLQIFMLAAPAFVAILSKIGFYSLLVYFATSMGTKTVAAHQVMIQLYCICAVWGEPLSQTAQSFMPELIYGANRSLAKVRQLLKSLVFIGALSGLILGSIGTSLPWLFPKIFSSDHEVIQEMHKVLIPFFIALFAAPPINCLEGTLMAGRDLKFLGISMTGIACLGTLLVKVLSQRGYGLTGCWLALVAFQLSLFTVLLRRLTLPSGILYSEDVTRYEHGKLKTV